MHSHTFKNVTDETIEVDTGEKTYTIKPGEAVTIKPRERRHFVPKRQVLVEQPYEEPKA